MLDSLISASYKTHFTQRLRNMQEKVRGLQFLAVENVYV